MKIHYIHVKSHLDEKISGFFLGFLGIKHKNLYRGFYCPAFLFSTTPQLNIAILELSLSAEYCQPDPV